MLNARCKTSLRLLLELTFYFMYSYMMVLLPTNASYKHLHFVTKGTELIHINVKVELVNLETVYETLLKRFS